MLTKIYGLDAPSFDDYISDLAEHDHTSYEWSQWWHKTARKPKRWKK